MLASMAGRAAEVGWEVEALDMELLKLAAVPDLEEDGRAVELLSSLLDGVPGGSDVDVRTFVVSSPDCSCVGGDGSCRLDIAGGEVALLSRSSFGSGGHPTTRCCLDALSLLADKGAMAGSVVLDVGTGSGILAIAADRMGAARVVALEIDRAAIEEARINLEANRCRAVTLVHGGIETVGGACFNVLLANLAPSVMSCMLPRLPRLLAPGGYMVLSGGNGGLRRAAEEMGAGRARLEKRWLVEGWETVMCRMD